MDKELIERLAKEAGCEIPANPEECALLSVIDLAKFAALVAEECAKICDTAADKVWDEYPDPQFAAAEIRDKFPAPANTLKE